MKQTSGEKTAATWRSSFRVNLIWTLGIPLFFLFTMEWIHRGTLLSDFWTTRFFPHFFGFFWGWVFLVFLYVIISQFTGKHWIATALLGILTSAAGIVTYYKLEMRGEPLLPWDFSQIGDLAGVAGHIELQIQPSMIIVGLLVLLLTFFAGQLRLPYGDGKRAWQWRLAFSGAGIFLSFLLVFGVWMQTTICQFFGIYEDMWMQDRYYKNYGIITGFFTNLRVLDIEKPEDYSEETITELVERTKANKEQNDSAVYKESYAASTENPEQKPNIIYVMNESFWDVSRLEGVVFDRELTPNLHALMEEAAYGRCYSPSFGGGTCDVEFEALTGFSLEHLPAGSKPYQQYVTKEMFSTPQYLKSQGYDTIAIHGYYRKFWSRNTAYPNLGIDTFIAAEDFSNPERRRGFISDSQMTQRIIEEYEKHEDESNSPFFVHAVTMQNHTTYDSSRYPESELVKVLEDPGFTDKTVSQLQDFATGVYEADKALGELVEYFRQVDEPTIIVFWGDHYNPLGSGYEVFEKTGYIEEGDTTSPNLRQTDLLIWSNYYSESLDLGTIAAYEISPVTMDLYGLEKPTWYDFLIQELAVMRARTRGITVEPDGTFSEEMTEEQMQWYNDHWLLQYDYMFGEPYQEDYVEHSD